MNLCYNEHNSNKEVLMETMEFLLRPFSVQIKE